MPRVTFVTKNSRVEVDVPVGTSLMRGAVSHGIDGIIGDCGGQLSCATCHVIVADRFVDKLPAISAAESEMLDFAATERQPNSRLSCQIVMTDELEGLTVQPADAQI